jgi:hypothetical protein
MIDVTPVILCGRSDSVFDHYPELASLNKGRTLPNHAHIGTKHGTYSAEAGGKDLHECDAFSNTV